ncbi:Ionotropic receptor 10a [Carabus blaptoides fortunei]
MLDFGTVSGSYFEMKDITPGLEYTTDLENRLLEQWIRCDTGISQCLENVAFDRNYSMAVPKLFMAYTSNNYETSNGKSLIYCFQETLLTYPIVLYGYRGLPFMPRINTILAAVTSSGIMNKWKDDLKSVLKKQHIDDDHAVRVITLGHLQGAFVVYTFGSAVSIVSFIAEHIVFHVREKYFVVSSR